MNVTQTISARTSPTTPPIVREFVATDHVDAAQQAADFMWDRKMCGSKFTSLLTYDPAD